MFGFFLIGRILGDPRGFPIWSERSAVFRFVRICSGLFGGDSAWMVVLGVRGWVVGGEVGIVRTFVLLCDGSTVGESWGSWTIGVRRDWCCRLVAFHPPPNLPPGRGEG